MTINDRDQISANLLNRALAASTKHRLTVRDDFQSRVLNAAALSRPRARRTGFHLAMIGAALFLSVGTAVAAIVHFASEERKPVQYACVECFEELAAQSPFAVGDPAGIDSSALTRADSLPQLYRSVAVREDLRIAGDDHEFFDVRVSARGAIAAREGSGTVRIYSPAGSEIAVVKPQERLTTLTWGWVGDSLWFHTNSSVQVVALTPSPRVVSTRPVPAETPGPPGTTPRTRNPWPSIDAMYRNGDLLLKQSFPRDQMLAALGPAADGDLPSSFFVRTNTAHQVVAYAPGFPVDWSTPCEHRPMEQSAVGDVTYRVPFCNASVGTSSPDGRRVLYGTGEAPVSNPARLRLAQVMFAGETVYDREYEIPAAQITGEQADSIRAAAAVRWLNSPDPRITAFLDSVSESTYPTHRNPVDDAVLGDDGSVLLWLMRFSESPRYLLIDPQGDPVGTFTLPRDVLILEVSRNAMWGVRRRPDTPDSQPWYHVVRYRVVP